jgi:VCBS repeat-containing protein
MANNISGTTASDTLNGLSGDNVISGGAGNDKLNGGAGVDTLDGGTGSDTISGNSGDDTLVFDATAGGGPSLDLYDGGSGKDTLKLLLSYSQWSSGSFQTELANYLQFIDVHTQWRTQEADNSEYTLSSFGGGLSLRGSKIEFVKVIVDGVDIGNPVDEGVTAVADSITVSEDGPPGSVNVLANDSIPDLTGSVTFGPLGQPSKGTVSEVFPHIYSGLGSPSHILQYTPTPGAWDYLGVGIASATETFTYTVTDVDGDSQTATVTVTIVGANDAPVAVADTGSATEAGTAPGAGAGGNVLTNDTDVDTGDSKIVSAVNGAAGNVGQALDGAYGALTLNGDGTYSYVVDNANPTVDALRLPTDTLTDSFTYKVKDAAGAESQATLTITIHGANDAPVFVSGQTGTVAENAPAATVVYDADVTDVDGLAAVFSITGTDAELFSIDPATGEVRFNASPDFESPGDSDGDNIYDITVNAFDGLATTSRNVAIDVTNANEAPSITSNGGGDTASASVAENTTAVTSVTAADPDVPTALTYSIVPGGDGAKFTIDGSTGALSFLTAPNFEAPGDSDANNSYVVTVRASDGSLHDDQTITVAVTDVAEGSPPVAHPENVIISTGTVGQIPISALLANDTDPDLQTVSFNGIVSAVGGTVTDLGNGLLSVGSGVTSFTYTVKDTTNAVSNAATVTVLRQAVGGGNTNDNIDISAQTYVASYIDAASGNDSVTGGGGVDNFIGGSGADRLVGGNGPDTMLGGSGNDVLTGGLGDDVLDGGSNNNTLTGGGGNDTLTGSPGNGANNADVFVFTSINDGADVITNFAEGSDKIDLSAIDANGALAGDPLFGFNPLQTSATQNFGVTWEQSGSGNTIIRVDTDGQPGAELIITLLGLHTLQSTDFVL